jgi:hypothetical protein
MHKIKENQSTITKSKKRVSHDRSNILSGTPYGINSVISKPMTLVENVEIGQFLLLIMRILTCFTC